jgi:hypothetical protein
MTHAAKMFVAGVAVFLVAPMPIIFKEVKIENDPRLFDCRFAYTAEQCKEFAAQNKKAQLEVTTPLLAVTMNKETLDYFSGNPPEKDYVVTPLTALGVPIVITASVLFLLHKRHGVKVDKKASKKRPMNIWKM